MLEHASYSYYAYFESRQKSKNSRWIEHEKTFCNIFVTDIHREKKKLNKKLFTDFHILNMFLYLILVV